MSKNIYKIGLVVFLGFGAWLFTTTEPAKHLKGAIQENPSARPVESVPLAPVSPPQASQKTNPSAASTSTEESSASHIACRAVRWMDEGRAIEPMTQEALKGCYQFLSSTGFLYNGRSAESCLNESPQMAPSQECLDLTYAFQATDNMLGSSAEQWDHQDDKVLMTALTTFQENYTDRHAEKLAEFIDYMGKRFPDDAVVAKAALVPLKANTSVEVIEHLRLNLDKAKRLNPNDPEILGAEMLVAVTNGERDALEHLEEFTRQNRNSGLGLVYAAAIYHVQGRSDLAKDAIAEASKDTNPSVQKLVRPAQDYIEGKSDQVGALVLGGTVVYVSGDSLPRIIRAH